MPSRQSVLKIHLHLRARGGRRLPIRDSRGSYRVKPRSLPEIIHKSSRVQRTGIMTLRHAGSASTSQGSRAQSQLALHVHNAQSNNTNPVNGISPENRAHYGVDNRAGQPITSPHNGRRRRCRQASRRAVAWHQNNQRWQVIHFPT